MHVSHRSKKPRSLRSTLGSVGFHVGACALTAIVLYPVVWLIGASFKPSTEIIRSLAIFPEAPTLDNYVTALGGIAGIPAARFFLNSTFLALASVIGTVASSAITAYAFARIRFRFSSFWFAVMIGTLLLPGHVLIIPHYILFQNLGMVGTYWPLLVGKFLAGEAFFIFLIMQFLRGIPLEIDEAAKIDGAGHARRFWSIILPLIRPALATTAIFAFLWSWNDFLGPLLYLHDPTAYPLPMALRLFVDQTSTSNYGAMIAMSMLALLPVLLFYVLFQRLIVQGVATQGVKG